MVEFDKVHYPLSLSKVNAGTEKTHLLGIIDSLRKELAAKSQGSAHKSLANPMLDISLSRSHAPTHTFMGSGTLQDQTPILSPQTEILKHQPRYGQDHIHPEANSMAIEGYQQKVKLLEQKMDALQRKHESEILKQQEEHAEEMRTILRHAQELENQIDGLNKEIDQWKDIAEQRRESGGKEREKNLLRDIETLKRKLNEANSNEKLLRAQLKKATETIDYERKKYGVAFKPASREKIQRPGSPWKKSASRSGTLR